MCVYIYIYTHITIYRTPTSIDRSLYHQTALALGAALPFSAPASRTFGLRIEADFVYEGRNLLNHV